MAKTEKPVIKQPGENTWPFKLGDEVKDQINGVTGVLIARFYHITGCDRFMLETPVKDDKVGELYECAAERLELVTAHPERHREEVPDIHIKLGDQVKSVMSGVAGTATIIQVPLHGAIRVDVQPKWDPKEKKMPDGYFIDVGFLEVVEPYTPRPKPEKTPQPSQKQVREPGCSRMSKGGMRR